MASIEDLGRLVKAKHPGAYDDLADADLGRSVKVKFPGAYDDFLDAPAKPPGLLSRIAKGAGEIGSAAAAGAASLGQVLDPAVAAAGALGSYVVPHTAPEGASLGDRFKNEMEGLRRTREERFKASPNAFGAGGILEGAAAAPALLRAAPVSRMAEGGPLLSRAAAGAADAAGFNAVSQAASSIDQDPIAAGIAAGTSPANLLGAAPALVGPLAEVAQAARPGAARLVAKVLPKVQPTPAAQLLRREGVPLTLGQANPDTFYAAFEQASADQPLGMHLEQGTARDAFGNVVINKAQPPGAGPIASGSPQERLAATRAAFDDAYAPLKGQPVDPTSLADLPRRALQPAEGVPESARKAAAERIKDALTSLPNHRGVQAPAEALLEAGPELLTRPSATKPVLVPIDGETKAVRLPEWLSPEDFAANREAWDWTWHATGGPDAPEQIQKLIHQHMQRAVAGGAEDFGFGANAGEKPPLDDFSLKQGFTAARLAKGLGGKKWAGVRRSIAEWAAMPEDQRPPDPIPEGAWGNLIDTTRRDVKWGEGNRYGDLKKVDALSKLIAGAKTSIYPQRSGLQGPEPSWYTDVAGAAPLGEAAPAEGGPTHTVGDLIKVRSNMRDARRAAVAKGDGDMVKALEHGLDTVTGAIESSLPREQVGQLRGTDAQYRKFMTVEDAAAKGGPESNIHPRALASVLPRSSGKAATVEGRAGELQDLAQAGTRTFDTRVKPTGMRGPILAMVPKPLAGAGARLLNSPSIKAALLGEQLSAPVAPPAGAPLTEAQARAMALAQALRQRGPTLRLDAPGFAPIPTTASEDDRRP